MTDEREKTYRRHNCERALIPNLFLDNTKSKKSKPRVLDFGCGKDQIWVEKLKKLGYDAEGFDLSLDHTPKGKFNAIILSNVVNVQRNSDEIMTLAHDVLTFLKKGGYLYYNIPSSPSKIKTLRADGNQWAQKDLDDTFFWWLRVYRKTQPVTRVGKFTFDRDYPNCWIVKC